MAKAQVIVSHYDDRGDPYPPNNFRPEIKIGSEYIGDVYACNRPYNGCMPLKKAITIARKWAEELNIPMRPCEVYGYDQDGNKIEKEK